MSVNDIICLDPAEIAAEHASALQKQTNHFYFQHKLASGELREVEACSTPIASGGETVLFSVIHDITERTASKRLCSSRKTAWQNCCPFQKNSWNIRMPPSITKNSPMISS